MIVNKDLSQESAELIAGFQFSDKASDLSELEYWRNKHETLSEVHKRNCKYIRELKAEIEVLKATEEVRLSKKRLKEAFKTFEALNKS